MSLIPSWCQELRAARLARGWSEDDLADQIQNWEYRHGAGRHLGVSRSYVSEWETGKRGVSRDYAVRIEGVTGIPRDHFIDHRSSRGRVVRLQEAEVGLQWADDLDGAVEGLIDLWRSRLDRREFQAAMAATAVISEVALRWLVSPVDVRVERDAGARLVGHSDIDAVRVMQQSMKAIDDRHGGGVALPMAVEYLRGEVAPLLRARYTDSVGRALFSATSEFTLGVGWMAYDAGKHGLAQRYMAQALRMSHAADDRAFGGRILAAMSHQALHLGDVRHGTDFACAARAGTQGAVTPTVVMMLAAMEACAHAARGDGSLCLRALSDAERAFARSTPGEDPPWVEFDEGALAGHLARCFRDLDRPREAEQFALRSIQLCHPAHLRTRVQRYAILASAHAQQGDLEEACVVGRQALAEVGRLRSKRTLDDVARLVQLVGASGSQVAHEFTEEATEVLGFR
ncbi:MAG TPA: helix-turn-helix domain-containing protein [Actinomycetes bacterium]|nr:helix-turn-helix domain-containing protein [Actinomycetes bacterium]